MAISLRSCTTFSFWTKRFISIPKPSERDEARLRQIGDSGLSNIAHLTCDVFHRASATGNVQWSTQELVKGWAVGPSQENSMHKDENQIVETAAEARGGRLGRPVLLVLLVSCGLAVVGVLKSVEAPPIEDLW